MSESAQPTHDAIVTIRDVHLHRGVRAILTGATLDVGRGEIVALMGASGSGKTTLLRAIAGLEAFEQGTIAVDGVTLGGGPSVARSIRDLRHKVGMVFQFHCLFEHISALQNVWLAPVHVHRIAQSEAESRALELMSMLGVEHRARALPRELSGGEAQRLAIARPFATEPPVLLTYKPT